MKFTYFLLSAMVLLNLGCKKFLNETVNPNSPITVPAANNLPAIETQIATQITGGNATFGVSTITSYWMQQMALNQEQPQIDGYKITPDATDWSLFYPTLKNLQLLNTQSAADGNYSYAGITQVLSVYTMQVVTDLWGDVPYSESLKGVDNLDPKYDAQEDIYKGMQAMLDDAISDFAKDPGKSQPASDDLIYGGDIGKWKKFAYTLKARLYMHLTKAPGHTAAAQADSALTALQNGFTSNGDEPAFAYPGSAGFESPWYQNTLSGAGGVVLASTLIDSLVARNDPRLPVIADTAISIGGYHGRVIGSGANPDPDAYSRINDFYAGAGASIYIMTYTEALFLQAEATLIKSGPQAAQPFYQSGILAHMTKLGLNPATETVVNYISQRGTLTSNNALQRIMEEKDISDFLSIENYNDWRRTGFPKLVPVQNSYYPAIPLRFPYPLTSVTSNPQPQQSATVTTPVWWDQ